MSRSSKIYFSTIVAALTLSVAFLQAESPKPKFTVKEVMKTLHKGDDNIGKHVASGNATKEEIAKLVEYYSSLPLNDPPRGEKASWHEKTTALVSSAKALQAGKPGAIEAYKQASNCKACHSVHKPEQPR
jgi:hypothetical protein